MLIVEAWDSNKLCTYTSSKCQFYTDGLVAWDIRAIFSYCPFQYIGILHVSIRGIQLPAIVKPSRVPTCRDRNPNNITNVQMPTYTRTGFFPLQGIKKYSQPLLLRDENHKTFIPNIAGLCIPKATHKNDVFYNKCDRFKNKTNNPPKNNLPSLSWSLFHLFYNFKMCVSDWNTLSQWIAILRPFNKW